MNGRPSIGPGHRDYATTEAQPVPDDTPSVTTNGVAPTATGVTLPALPEVKRWVTRTRQDRAALQARADRLKLQFEPIRRELAGVERSIKVLDHFLAQVAVAGDDASSPLQQARRSAPGLLEGQWSRKFAACQGCGTTERRHKAHGYCGRCFDSPSSRTVPAPASDVMLEGGHP